jgi:hypothetical protein
MPQMLVRLLRYGAAPILLVCVVFGASACGSSSGANNSTTTIAPGVVTAPELAYDGCTYAPNGKIPAGEPAGIRPHFSAFVPDSSATSAEGSMRVHGGGVLVNGFILPSGTQLHAGPDLDGSVGAIPSHYAVLVAEPVVWTSHANKTWIAFFVACGGPNLYWVSLDQMRQKDPSAAKNISTLLATEKLEPLAVSDGHLVLKSKGLSLVIGRGELFGPVAG